MKPDYVSRKAWGAKAPTSRTPLPASAIRVPIVHYTASDADEQDLHRNCAARVRGVQRFHMSPTPSDPTKPWADIAYSFLVCRHGFTFVGRGWGIRTAATGPANGFSLAFCFLGNDTAGRRDVTPAAFDELRLLVAEFRRRYGRPRVRVRGHRDYMVTSCPGDELYALLARM